MSDNVSILEPGSAPFGYTLSRTAAKQVGGPDGPKFQRVVPTIEVGGAQVDVGAANPMPVEIADGKLVTLGALTDAAAPNTAGARSVVSLLKAIAGWTFAPFLGASEAHIGQVGGDTAIATGSFVRPADTIVYAPGDLVANTVAPATVAAVELTVARKQAGTGRIARARLTRSKPEGGMFRLHLYRTAPTVHATSGDNAAFLTDGAIGYLGAFDITVDRVFSDGAKGFGVPTVGAFIAFEAGAGSQRLYALVEARSAVTPASGETFTITLEVDRD